MFTEDFSQQGEGLDGEQQDMDNTIVLATSTPVPSENCCYLFDLKDYRGESKEICHDGETKGLELKKPYFNQGKGFWHKMESYVCGKNTNVTFCWDFMGHDCRDK